MRKVLGLAAAGLLAAGAAQAGTLTVANSDIVLYGGVSAAYDWQDNDIFARTIYPNFNAAGTYTGDSNPTNTFNRDNFHAFNICYRSYEKG
ncbi:MAG: hypothetical protein Q9M89_05240 [Persephonella sp.]|nr:hypothetical protein [Persephonella sp.]